MKRKKVDSKLEIFEEFHDSIDEDLEEFENEFDDRYIYESDFDNSISEDDNVEHLFEESDSTEESNEDILNYREYAFKKSTTKKVSSQNYDAADLHVDKQDINVPRDCPIGDDYFNKELEESACEVIKGTTLEKHDDGRRIPIKDVVTCFVKLASKWPDDLVYCFMLMALYGKVLRYKSLLDAIPTSYRDKMFSQMSTNGALMLKALYKKDANVVDIFC